MVTLLSPGTSLPAFFARIFCPENQSTTSHDLWQVSPVVRVRLTFVHTAEEHKRDRVSRDDVQKVVRFREAWQEDRVAEEVQERTVVAVAQRGSA
jgi:hypothetical protein